MDHTHQQPTVTVIARSTDPETSLDAAADLRQKQDKLRRCLRTVVEIIYSCGELSDFEIRDRWGVFWGNDKWSTSLPRKARHWAREAGLVRHAGFTTHQGRRVRKWGLGDDRAVVSAEYELCPTCGHKVKRRESPDV